MSMEGQFIYINLRGVDKVTKKMRRKESGKGLEEDGRSSGEGGGREQWAESR